jgi:hypothetical protein
MPFDSKKLFHWKNDQELWEYGHGSSRSKASRTSVCCISKIDTINDIFEVEAEWLNSYEAGQRRISAAIDV